MQISGICLTGRGKINLTAAMQAVARAYVIGKTPAEVAALAKKYYEEWVRMFGCETEFTCG